MIWFFLACNGTNDPTTTISTTDSTTSQPPNVPLWSYLASYTTGEVALFDETHTIRYTGPLINNQVFGPILVFDSSHMLSLDLLVDSEEQVSVQSALPVISQSTADDGSVHTQWRGQANGAVTPYTITPGDFGGVLLENDPELGPLEEIDRLFALHLVSVSSTSLQLCEQDLCTDWEGASPTFFLVQRAQHNPAAGGTFHGGGYNEYLTNASTSPTLELPTPEIHRLLLNNSSSSPQTLTFTGDASALGEVTLEAGETAQLSVALTDSWAVTTEVSQGSATFNVVVF